MGDTANKVDPKTQTLHPVYTVTNIQHKVRVLDGVKVSYSSWVKLFMLHAKGYDVINHIDGSPAPTETTPEYSSWAKIDAVVLQWIYGTLTDDLLVRVLTDESTAYEAWKRVKKLFLNNKGLRSAALQHELTNLTLAAMPSLEAYCQRIRNLVDQLVIMDCPVNDTQQILHLVHGLPHEYDTIATILNQNLPVWEEAVEQLQSEARRIAAREHITPTPIVAAAVNSPPSNTRDHQPSSHHNTQHRRSTNNQPRLILEGMVVPPIVAQMAHLSPNIRGPTTVPQHLPYYAYSPQFAPPPYWTPQPCPYPTQNWVQPLEQRPNT